MKSRTKFSRSQHNSGEKTNLAEDQYPPMNMQDIGRLRRTGSIPGWDTTLNDDGTFTLRRQNDISSIITKYPKAQQAVSVYPGITRDNMSSFNMKLPDMGATRQINRFLGLTPEIKSATYGELNWGMLPGFQSDQSGTQGEIIEFDYEQNIPDVDISQLVPLRATSVIPLNMSKRKGLPSVFYTPDGMKTSEYINALRMQNRNTKRYNSYVDVVNAMKNRYNKQQAQ